MLARKKSMKNLCTVSAVELGGLREGLSVSSACYVEIEVIAELND